MFRESNLVVECLRLRYSTNDYDKVEFKVSELKLKGKGRETRLRLEQTRPTILFLVALTSIGQV